MDSKKRKAAASGPCYSGMAVLLMIKPLSDGTHPAVLIAIGLAGVAMIVFGIRSYSRLVAELERTIDELRRRPGGLPAQSETREPD